MEYKSDVEALRENFKTGFTKPLEWRLQQLEALDRMYVENLDLFVEALDKDLRKPKWETVSAEIEFLRNDIRGFLANLKDWMKPKNAPKSVLTVMDKAKICPEPYGVVLVMGAWNYPFNLTLGPLAGAICAGNCVVVKPSELTEHSAQLMAMLLPRYVDQRAVKVVQGGIPETTALLKERFDYVFYTGGTTVGRIVREAANKYLTPCTLELGGKSPCYLDDDCNLPVALKRILWGKTVNLGQTCIAPDYLLCSKQTEAKVRDLLPKLIKECFGEDPKKSRDLARIVNERHFDRLMGLITNTQGNIAIGELTL